MSHGTITFDQDPPRRAGEAQGGGAQHCPAGPPDSAGSASRCPCTSMHVGPLQSPSCFVRLSSNVSDLPTSSQMAVGGGSGGRKRDFSPGLQGQPLSSCSLTLMHPVTGGRSSDGPLCSLARDFSPKRLTNCIPLQNHIHLKCKKLI